jgi:hypothetical protein
VNPIDRSGVIRFADAQSAIPGPGGERDAFEAGDLLFVAAGVEHHYEAFTDDLALWRIFYGPAGGEAVSN